MQETKSPNVATDRPMRQSVFERTRYAPSLPQEEFIVPLLRREIESCIERYATPARGAAKAIDIGCGGQPYLTLFEQVGYCGVDVNPVGGPPVDVVCAALPGELLRRKDIHHRVQARSAQAIVQAIRRACCSASIVCATDVQDLHGN